MKKNCGSSPDSITEVSSDFLHNVMHSCRPEEKARNCPNCGELHWDSELNYSSTKRIDCDNGSYASTLYGVCRKCAARAVGMGIKLCKTRL